jgi:hypothetical protein
MKSGGSNLLEGLDFIWKLSIETPYYQEGLRSIGVDVVVVLKRTYKSHKNQTYHKKIAFL